MYKFRRWTPEALNNEYDDLIACHAAELLDLRLRVRAKVESISVTIDELRDDLSVVKDLESRLG